MRLENGTSKALRKYVAGAIATVVLAPFCLAADIHAQPARFQSGNYGSARLRISIRVMPIVQASSMAQPVPQGGPVLYSFDTNSREQMYEVRSLPPNSPRNAGGEAPAILKTLIVVPR